MSAGGLGIRRRAWFAAYTTNQRVRHLLGLHQRPRTYSIAPRCDWCGHRSASQRGIAAANWAAMFPDQPADEESR